MDQEPSKIITKDERAGAELCLILAIIFSLMMAVFFGILFINSIPFAGDYDTQHEPTISDIPDKN